ncbi:MAG: DUF4230 domain-containing protein [Bacteroidota bacterium]
MRRNAPYLLLVIISFVCGILSYRSCVQSRNQQVSTIETDILLERIRDVCKMVTVEGDVMELYNETQTRYVTMYLPLPTQFSFDKKATVQVQGTVLVGYDLEGLNTTVSEEERTVTISNLPQPSVLAVEHQLEFRNMEESWFNSFGPADLTELSNNAREALRDKALESELVDRAKEQGLGLLNTIQHIAESAGYTFILEEAVVDTTAQLPELFGE